MNHREISALVLAAGKGTRMKSNKAKVLHEVFFAPMIHHVIDALQPLALTETIVVVGHQRQQVEETLQETDVLFAHQQEQLGTGHAVLAAQEMLAGTEGALLILCGDTPLISTETLREMMEHHAAKSAKLTVMTTELDAPTNYGRIVTDSSGNILAIVEQKDATPEQLRLNEINAGIYCIDIDFLYEALPKVDTNNQQGEFYLTDIVGLANVSGHAVNRFVCSDPQEVLGVNSRVELAVAHARLQERRNRELMAGGVTLFSPESIWISKSVSVGADTIIHPNVHMNGQTTVGSNCVIGPFSMLNDCEIANGVTVGAFSYLEGCRLDTGASVAPKTIELSGGR